MAPEIIDKVCAGFRLILELEVQVFVFQQLMIGL